MSGWSLNNTQYILMNLRQLEMSRKEGVKGVHMSK
jgi:hypothetical protein